MKEKATNWFNALLGKPKLAGGSAKAQKKPVDKDSTKNIVDSVNKTVNGDSVQKDIEIAENFIKSVSNRLSSVVGSKVPKKLVLDSQKVASSFNKIPIEGLKKVIYPFMVIVLVLVVLFVGIGVFRILREGGDGGNGRVSQETVTPVVYRPKEPSVYANDAIILQIETDINVLLGEMYSKVLKESTLIPPRLDFNIKFD